MKRKGLFLALAAALIFSLVWMAESTPSIAMTGDPLIDGFLMVEVASVADAIEQVLGQRAHMSTDLQPLFPTKFAGPAVTVMMKKEEHKEGSKAFQGALDAIDSAQPGSVYVMVLEDGKDTAGIGGLMGTAMHVRGMAGAVLDAGVRDVPQLRRIQFPVYSRGPVPSTSIKSSVIWKTRPKQRAYTSRRSSKSRSSSPSPCAASTPNLRQARKRAPVLWRWMCSSASSVWG